MTAMADEVWTFLCPYCRWETSGTLSAGYALAFAHETACERAS